MLTVKDVAERYAVGLHTVLTWIHAGDLRAMNLGRTMNGGKPRWRIKESDLEAFELLRMASPPAPKIRARRRQPEVIQFYA